MSAYIHTESDLADAIAALIALDPRWAPVVERAGRPPLRRREGGFAGLVQIIVSQQVSVASAAAIHGRLVAIGDPFDHTSVLRARKDKLLRVGLSNAKVKTLKAIARAISTQTIAKRRSTWCTNHARSRGGRWASSTGARAGARGRARRTRSPSTRAA